jgi:hypothetical protein
MTSGDLVTEALGCGFEEQDGIFVRASGGERLVLFVGANFTPNEIARGEEPGGWTIRDARQPLLPGSWAELNRVAPEMPAFSLRARSSWLLWRVGVARRLADRHFARRFQLDGASSLALFDGDVRRALMEMPHCAGFHFYVMRTPGKAHRNAMIATWPLERAPSGIISGAALACDLIARVASLRPAVSAG